MTSTTETGHAKNAANLDTLISFVVGYGVAYNPSKAALKLAGLQTLSTSSKAAIANINTTKAAYSNAVAAREVAFLPLSPLATRILNALKATDTTTQVDDSAKTIVRKLKGQKATTKLTEEEKAASLAQGKSVKEVSASQLSFDSQLDNFDKLIKLLISVALYTPNETDLKTATLTTMYNDLKAKNTAVVTTATALSNARIARNDLFYKPNTGLVDLALDTKSYIKSLFGANSPQYKQVAGIEFRNVKS